MPGAPEIIGAFADHAVASGARRLVMLSGQRAEVAEQGERRLQASGADWTILHAAWFNQNFDEGFLRDPVRSGRVELPVGDTPEPFIDADDIAEAATAILTEDGHTGMTYELTGPRLLSFADAVAEIADATGQSVRFISIAPEIYAERFAAEGRSPAEVKQSLYLFTDLMDGRNAHVENGVRQVLGREPKDFAEYARRAAETGIWRSL